MKLFETTWKSGYSYYERTQENGVSKKHKIGLPSEWYEELSTGEYSYILDNSIKLTRKQGKAKDGRGEYGFIDPMYRNIKDQYWNKNLYNPNPKIWYLDIETRVGVNSTGFPVPERAAEEVVLIQLYDSYLDTMIVIGTREWYHEADYTFDYKVKYIKVADEVKLFEAYFQLFKKLDPLIIYAWHGIGFDFPYLYNRVKLLGLDTNSFSNYGDSELKESQKFGKPTFKFTSDGHHYIDLLDVYQKFTFGSQASFSLEFTANKVVGAQKVDHSEYAKFDDFYSGKYVIPENPTPEQKASKIYKAAVGGDWEEVRKLAYSDFVYYGCIDTHLILEIDKAKNFTAILLMISEKMGVTISDALGTVKPWSQYIMNKALLDKQVIGKRVENDDEISIKGGYVREPQVQMHHWILSADVNSMYPLLGMVGFNMSPETYIPKHKLPVDLREIVLRYFNDEDEETKMEITPEVWAVTTKLLKKYKYTLGINGAVFSTEKTGMIPELVQDIYATRKVAKRTMFSYEKRKLLIKDILNEKATV